MCKYPPGKWGETAKVEIDRGKEKPAMLDYLKINCICSLLGEPEF
jgi:hypothetical protein